MSERILASPWFLATTVIVCGLVTAFTSWLADESSDGVRLLAALIGLGIGLGVMLLIAWAMTDDKPAPTIAPVETPPPPPPIARHDELHALLERGRTLEPGADVESWISDVRAALERDKPGVVGYFDQLGTRAYADDRERLDAHVARLETIARDFF